MACGSTTSPTRVIIGIRFTTHFIEERKESSGTRIVEITINNETDIDLIKSCVISENDYRVSTSNFNPAPIVGNFADDCQKTINCFVLHLNGNSVIGPVSARKYRQLIDAGIYVEKISGNGPATYINKVVELYLKGMKIKNCWLCAFHCLHYQYVESFCKLLKITLNNTNRAVECKSFKLKKIIPECDLIKDATDRVMNSREEKPARKQPPRTQQNNQNQVITYTDVRIKTTAIDFFDKILNNKNTYIPSTNIHRPSIEVIFIGHFLECDKCGSTLVFVTSAVFEYLLGRSDSYPFMSWSGDFYAKSKLDKLFAATVEERPSTHKFGTLVRQNGNLFVQCTNCSNITAPENPTPVTLFRRTLSEEAYKLVYKNQYTDH